MREKKYYPGIDILKFFAVLAVVLFHYADHGIVDLQAADLSYNWILLGILKCGGGIGNCLFILITGFLSINRKFDARVILKLWLQVFVASVIGQAAYCMFSGSMPGLKNLVKTFLPVTFNVYWYFSSYIVIYLLMPFINTLLDTIGQRKHQILAVLSIVLFSVIPTFTTTAWLTGINQIAMMIALYLVGGYYRKYGMSINARLLDVAMVLSMGFILVSEYVIRRFTGFDPFYFAWEMNKTPIVVFAVALFLRVMDSNMGAAFPAKIISKHAFGIYLIHIGWMSPLLYEKLFVNTFYSSPLMILHIAGYLVAVLVVCVLIDHLYQLLYKKVASNAIEKIGSQINSILMN